ncbi:MAG: hypothetical protein COW65_10380 [Cytophagales bacterium CG18_big_fil_WC_8_21_14_2_50_42_9]|nr:MAG: hypothetical protein COW65_10380 [Cytophagales bacterium CG18_big_fil_WC_8_21_14_2_50_42_9]
MKLVLKVLVLFGLIAIGKWERENAFYISKQPATISYPVYSQNTSSGLEAKEINADFQKKLVRVNF